MGIFGFLPFGNRKFFRMKNTRGKTTDSRNFGLISSLVESLFPKKDLSFSDDPSASAFFVYHLHMQVTHYYESHLQKTADRLEKLESFLHSGKITNMESWLNSYLALQSKSEKRSEIFLEFLRYLEDNISNIESGNIDLNNTQEYFKTITKNSYDYLRTLGLPLTIPIDVQLLSSKEVKYIACVFTGISYDIDVPGTEENIKNKIDDVEFVGLFKQQTTYMSVYVLLLGCSSSAKHLKIKDCAILKDLIQPKDLNAQTSSVRCFFIQNNWCWPLKRTWLPYIYSAIETLTCNFNLYILRRFNKLVRK
jgi:hypothetical protein